MTTLLKSLARSLRTILRWLLYTLEAPLMYLFGRDIFISYSQADAPNYAQQLAIDVRGAERLRDQARSEAAKQQEIDSATAC
jgi:hypothetical protein